MKGGGGERERGARYGRTNKPGVTTCSGFSQQSRPRSKRTPTWKGELYTRELGDFVLFQ
jgi:hypothetical protein